MKIASLRPEWAAGIESSCFKQSKTNKQNQEAGGMALRIKVLGANCAGTHRVEGETHT